MLGPNGELALRHVGVAARVDRGLVLNHDLQAPVQPTMWNKELATHLIVKVRYLKPTSINLEPSSVTLFGFSR